MATRDVQDQDAGLGVQDAAAVGIREAADNARWDEDCMVCGHEQDLDACQKFHGLRKAVVAAAAAAAGTGVTRQSGRASSNHAGKTLLGRRLVISRAGVHILDCHRGSCVAHECLRSAFAGLSLADRNAKEYGDEAAVVRSCFARLRGISETQSLAY